MAAKSVDVLQLSAKNVELADELSHVKLQSAAGATVSNDLKSVAGACERHAKRAKLDASEQKFFYYALYNGVFGSFCRTE